MSHWMEEAVFAARESPTFTVNELADAAGVSVSTVHAWIKDRGLPARKRVVWFIGAGVLQAWLDHTTVVTPAVRARLAAWLDEQATATKEMR